MQKQNSNILGNKKDFEAAKQIEVLELKTQIKGD